MILLATSEQDNNSPNEVLIWQVPFSSDYVLLSLHLHSNTPYQVMTIIYQEESILIPIPPLPTPQLSTPQCVNVCTYLNLPPSTLNS